MNSALLRLNGRDVLKGGVSAVFAAVFIALYNVVSTPDFDLFSVDWVRVLKLATNAAVSAFIGYLGKNLLTDSQGLVLGKI